MQISFEEVEALHKRLAGINRIPFADIEWTRGGQPLVVTPEEAEDWRFVGLSNTAFVECYEQDILTTIQVAASP